MTTPFSQDSYPYGDLHSTATHDVDGSPLPPVDLAGMRVAYDPQRRLIRDDLADGWEPLFHRWLLEAMDAGVVEPNAMVLGTVDGAGRVTTRTVLCKGIVDSAVQFFTTYTSTKGKALAQHPGASVTFPWIATQRQVHIQGSVTQLPREVSLAYWRTRPRGAQLSAWASSQSAPVDVLETVHDQLDSVTARFADQEVPMPPQWGGYQLRPEVVEFWQGGRDRFHQRLQYRVAPGGAGGTIVRLQP